MSEKLRCPRCGQSVRVSSGGKVFRHESVAGRQCAAGTETVDEVKAEQVERLHADVADAVQVEKDAEK